MSDTSRAVFLSYASQDADAAKRICEALRATGIEVWLDQSELRGGDAWDQKIRKQIKECALFVPIISANTQARQEGYFRLEWRLADQRTHLMSHDRAFIVPVVVDGTRDEGARVPDSFLAVQWMRLSAGEPDPRFAERVREMVSIPAPGGPASAPAKAVEDGRAGSVEPSVAGPGRAVRRRAIPVWTWGFLTAAAIGLGVWALLPRAVPTPANPASPTPNTGPATLAADKSIAVLPFENLSDDKDNTAFFADGMHEDILTNLANIRELRVVSRTSVMEYRGTKKKIPQIAKELGVAYILEGSVRRAGNTVRITGQLIRAANDEHLWAKSFDRELTPKELFAIQAALSTEIAAALHAVLSPQERSLLGRRPTENLAAYDLYLKGRSYGSANFKLLQGQEKYLQEAVALDPNFAEAWGELAAIHASHILQDFDHSPGRLAQADVAMAHAVRLAPESPDVIRLLGRYAYAGYRDYARATTQFEKVIQLQPNNSEAFSNLGATQRREGRWVEALANLRKAESLDPAQGSINVIATLGMARRWDEALAAQRRYAALRPDLLERQARLAQIAFFATGSTREADDLFARLAPAQRERPAMIEEGKFWAEKKGDYEAWKRLDRIQPGEDDDGLQVNRWREAVRAAFTLAAHGEVDAARARVADFPAEIRALLQSQPANARVWSALAMMEAVLGQAEAAQRDAQQAVALLPVTRDALTGQTYRHDLAVVYAWTGEKDRAVAELTRLFPVPNGALELNVHALRTDPEFFPLRGDPRFEALLNDPKNNEPLF